MKTGREIYQALTEAPNLRRAVKRLATAELTTVAVFLSSLRGDIGAQVFGVVSAELAHAARAASAKARKKTGKGLFGAPLRKKS